MNYILIGLLLSKQNILVAVFFMRALESMYLLVFLTYSFVPNKSVSIFCTPQALNSDKTMKMTVIDSQPLTPLLDVKHWPFGKNISDTAKSFCFNKTIDSGDKKYGLRQELIQDDEFNISWGHKNYEIVVILKENYWGNTAFRFCKWKCKEIHSSVTHKYRHKKGLNQGLGWGIWPKNKSSGEWDVSF